jgi:hypothetical protein
MYLYFTIKYVDIKTDRFGHFGWMGRMGSRKGKSDQKSRAAPNRKIG